MSSPAMNEYIQRLVESAPPLTPEQRDRIAFFMHDAPGETEHAPVDANYSALGEVLDHDANDN